MASKVQRSRRKIARQIDIPEDVFLAASVGDLEWLKHAVVGTWTREIPYDENGFSPLHVASAYARLDCVKYFVEKLQYDVNLPSKNHGWLPVHVVVNHLNDDRTLPCLKYLMLKGANVNGRNKDGTTALHQAAAEGDVESIKALIDRGANPLVEDSRGCTPLQLSKIWGHRDAARTIENAVWRIKKQDDAKVKHAHLESDKVLAVEDLKAAVEKLTNSPNDNASALGNWMRNHGLDDYSVKHNKFKRDKSVHPGRRMQSNIPDAPESPFNRPRAEGMTRRHVASPKPGTKHRGDGDLPEYALSEDDYEDYPDGKDIRTMTIQDLRAYHDKPWIKSFTKIPPDTYDPQLKDVYPRDEYTMTPTKFSSPFLNVGDIRQTKNMEIISEPMRQIRYEGKEKAQQISPRRFDATGRPVIFKAFRNILDVGPLGRPREANLPNIPRDEAALHLVNDPTSYLFKFSLQPGVLASDYKALYGEGTRADVE